jgi:hypothetical protein
MKLWLLTQNVNGGYDTYDSCVVAEESEVTAKLITPGESNWEYTWAAPKDVKALMIGEAALGITRGQVICASFNAG